MYKDTKGAEIDHTPTIATVFIEKGLEFESVFIDNDLNGSIELVRNNGGIKDIDDLVSYRCYYVACSRAGTSLMNATMLPKH